jgi:citrate synthase
MLTLINFELTMRGMMAEVTGWLTATAAAERLGVKPATLYAYVSRGVLSRRRSPTGQSLFHPAEVERLARRGRPRQPAGTPEVVIRSRITALGEDRPLYRGRDALELAGRHPFEAVAEWLWTGEAASLEGTPARWHAPENGPAAGRAAQSGLPPGVLPLERLQVITAVLATTDPLRGNLAPAAVVDLGRGLVAGMVDALPGPAVDGPIASRLWTKLTGRAPEADLVDALRAALVLLADHELAASTLAARIAASVRADPYAAVMAGLGTTGGTLHGGASLGAETMLADADTPARAAEAVGLRMRRGERIPGFGHLVYRSGDARATMLLDRVRAAAPRHDALPVADAVLAEAHRRRLPAPNVDFALAVLTRASGMPVGSGEAIFAVARTAGCLAHAMEEYENPSPLRLRSIYVGPA